MSLFHVMDARNKKFRKMLKEHNLCWTRHMKAAVNTDPDTWRKALSDFPLAPACKHRGQPMATRAEALDMGLKEGQSGKQFSRYFALFNCQYRLASPNSHPSIDRWHKAEDIDEDEDEWSPLLDNFTQDEWFVRRSDMKRSAMGDSKDVDWERWKEYKVSMILPRLEKKRGRLGYELLFIREPTVVNFPGFVWLLGKEYTGAEIIKAWRLMPLVRRAKPNGKY